MNETADAAAVLAPLWRRKWLILAIAVVVAGASYLYYSHQPSVYSATTQVYLGNGAEEQSQIGAGDASVKKAVAPNPTTQAALINSSVIKEATRAELRREPKSHVVRAALHGRTKAKTVEKTEFITIESEAHNARGAVLLANATAQTYVKRQNAAYRRKLEAAIALTRRQIRRIEAGQAAAAIQSAAALAKGKPTTVKTSSDATATIQSATLSTKVNQLESDLGVAQVTQVNPAKVRDALLVSPHPKSNALFGFAIGLLLASFAAYALSRFDRRLRSLTAIEQAFHTQVLAALRAVRHPIAYPDGRPAPAYVLREALWRLQATLRIAGVTATAVTATAAPATAAPPSPDSALPAPPIPTNGDADTPGGAGAVAPSAILCVSADPGDGRSTLIAALALAWAEAGERVMIVEADFRRPVMGRLLGVDARRGLADVLSGALTLEQATVTAAGAASPPGSVSLLAGVTGVANPPALLGRPQTGELVRALIEDYDHVLIDAPSPLQVSDAIPLLSVVDGIVIVARVGHTRVAAAPHLTALLARAPSAPVLGVVANAVSAADVKRYGIYHESRPGRGLHSLIGR